MKRSLATLAVAGLLLWFTGPGAAYQTTGRRWPAGASIVMALQQGSSGALIDGSPDWDTVTEGALSSWNPFLNGASFRVSRQSSSDVSLRNGVNNVAWADDVYGDAFGSAIAVAVSLSRNGVLTEVDVLFDRSRSWNAYRGNLRSASGGGTLMELRRVALHEFGHVIGLGHPDEGGESVAAVMNSRISNIDSLQPDDTNGARAIYGGSSPSSPSVPSNRAPSVSARCSPCTVEAELTAELHASGSDPDGDALTYQWSAAEGAFANARAADTDWTATPDERSVAVTVTVDDRRGGRASATLELKVIARDTLKADKRLLNGQSLVSANRRYRLAYQGDGNLVLYDEVAKQALWASNTGGFSVGSAVMQGDGNVVVYDAQGRSRFSTGTVNNAGAYLQIQNDGNLVVYRSTGQPIWDRGRPAAPVGSGRRPAVVPPGG